MAAGGPVRAQSLAPPARPPRPSAARPTRRGCPRGGARASRPTRSQTRASPTSAAACGRRAPREPSR
eukprot:4931026-Prymnesium_polylepis.1